MKYLKVVLLIIIMVIIPEIEALSEGTWTTYFGSGGIRKLSVHNEYLWCVTENGGLFRLNTRDMSYKRFTTMDGLTTNYAESIAFTSDNGVWCTTTYGSHYGGGVSYYDGTEWTTYTFSDGFGNIRVREVAVGSDGMVWCITHTGISRYDGNTWTSYTKADGLANEHIESLTIGINGEVWCTTWEGISWYNGHEWITFFEYDEQNHIYVSKIVIDNNGITWCATNNGLWYFDGVTWKTFTIADGLGSNTIKDIVIAPNGNIWCLTAKSVSLYVNDKWTTFGEDEMLVGNNVHELVIGSDGRVWCGSYADLGSSSYYYNPVLSYYDGKTWTSYKASAVMMDYQKFDMWAAPDGSVWFGKYKKSISRYNGETVQTFDEYNGHPSKSFTSLAFEPDGTAWIGANDLYRFKEGTLQPIIPSDGPKSSYSVSLVIDGDGAVWVGTSQGVSRTLKGKTWTHFSFTSNLFEYIIAYSLATAPDGSVVCGIRSSLPDDTTTFWRYNSMEWSKINTFGRFKNSRQVNSCAIGPDGALWIGTPEGLECFKNETWTLFTEADGLADNAIGPTAIEENGVVWAGTGESGVSKFDGVSWVTFTEADGLANNEITSIAVGLENTIWVGTHGGVSCYDGNTWTSFTKDDGLPGNVVNTVAIGPNGDVWIGIYDYVVRYNNIEWETFSVDDGLFSGYIQAISVSSDGYVWVGTRCGVSCFDDITQTFVKSTTYMPSSINILKNSPNPFNTSTTISFTLPATGFTQLVIYNITGQKVRQLVAETMTAGIHNIMWDGRDDSGNAVSSGVYMSQLSNGELVANGMMVLMK